MATDYLLQLAIERFWETVPSVWGRVRSNVRSNATGDFNITLIQFHILRHIRHGAHSVGELAERQQISRPAVSQVVDILVEKGLVTRRQDNADRRYTHLELTDQGNNIISVATSKSRRWMGEKMTSLNAEELEILVRAMGILKKTFDSAQ